MCWVPGASLGQHPPAADCPSHRGLGPMRGRLQRTTGGSRRSAPAAGGGGIRWGGCLAGGGVDPQLPTAGPPGAGAAAGPGLGARGCPAEVQPGHGHPARLRPGVPAERLPAPGAPSPSPSSALLSTTPAGVQGTESSPVAQSCLCVRFSHKYSAPAKPHAARQGASFYVPRPNLTLQQHDCDVDLPSRNPPFGRVPTFLAP